MELFEELSTTLQELRSEVRDSRGPFGLPRPPTPREILRFSESYAIPTAIAILEANIRALELLAATIRAIEGSASGAERGRERAESVGRATLERLEDVLADLQDAFEGRPPSDEARKLLDEARGLRDEIDERLGAPGVEKSRGVTGGADDTTTDPRRSGREVPVDVEGELESIKRNLEEENDDGRGTTENGGTQGNNEGSETTGNGGTQENDEDGEAGVPD